MLRLLAVLVALAVIAIAAVVWEFAPLPARTVTYEHFTCAIPYNWSLKSNDLFDLIAKRPLGGQFCVSEMAWVPERVPSQAPMGESLKKDFVSHGFEVASENHDPFLGYPAHSFMVRKKSGGHMVCVYEVSFVNGTQIYQLSVGKKDGDPLQDAQLNAVLNSFALIKR